MTSPPVGLSGSATGQVNLLAWRLGCARRLLGQRAAAGR